MSQSTGHYCVPSLPRRFMSDWLYQTAQVPTAVVTRRMNLEAVAEARAYAEPRPGWCALFTKAYALVGAVRPELRRAWISFPTTRIYEHPSVSALVAVERSFGLDQAVFFRRFPDVDRTTLGELDRQLHLAKEQPLEQCADFRRQLQLSGKPAWLRRPLWWYGLHTSGTRRVERIGTFAVCSVSHLGADSSTLSTPLTTSLHYGVVNAHGEVNVSLAYDQRILDAGTIARALEDMERVLTGDILLELRYLERLERSAA